MACSMATVASGQTISTIYVVGGSVSVVSCLLVLVCFTGTPALGRFPACLFRWRFICDGLVSAQFVLLNLHELTTTDEAACTAGLAFVLQFGIFGSLSWFACISLDLYLLVTRPFTRPEERTGSYHAWVWTGSLLTGLAAATRHGYRSTYHLCWTAADPPLVSSMWGLFFVWLMAYSCLSVR